MLNHEVIKSNEEDKNKSEMAMFLDENLSKQSWKPSKIFYNICPKLRFSSKIEPVWVGMY